MNSDITISALRKIIKETLKGYYDENEISSFSYLIFHHLLNYSKIDILLKGDEMISQHFYQQAETILKRLCNYEPVQYVLGKTEFLGLLLEITPDVLIPRPETEELVTWILNDHQGKEPKIMDLGTGSGCIAIALAKHLPKARVMGLDISEKALTVARKNAGLNGADVGFILSDMLEEPAGVQPGYDVLVSNPPYVRESEKAMMHVNVLKYEPHQALFVPDHDALIYYRAIAKTGIRLLHQSGLVYCEINEALGDQTIEVFRQSNYRDVELRRDINGKPRMIKAIIK